MQWPLIKIFGKKINNVFDFLSKILSKRVNFISVILNKILFCMLIPQPAYLNPLYRIIRMLNKYYNNLITYQLSKEEGVKS